MIFKFTPSNLGYQLFLQEKNCDAIDRTALLYCFVLCRWLVPVLKTQNMFHTISVNMACVDVD
jgi:hypothetical protein